MWDRKIAVLFCHVHPLLSLQPLAWFSGNGFIWHSIIVILLGYTEA